MKEGVERIHQLVEQWAPEDLLRWAFVTFGGYVEIASGFGPEGVVLIDIAAKVQPAFRIFTLDTDFLFPETYSLMERIEKRYGLRVERLRSAVTPEDQERSYGPALWGRTTRQKAVGVASVGDQHPP
jgi:phosphoadenosine phosphosulfate reductase